MTVDLAEEYDIVIYVIEMLEAEIVDRMRLDKEFKDV